MTMQARIRRIRGRRRSRRLFLLHRFRKDERGLQLVEVTIVLPILLMLFAGTAEFGRYFYEYTTLAKAARVGSRYLSTAPTEATEDTIAKNIVVYGNTTGTGTAIMPGLTTSNVKITRTGGTTLIPDKITVEITGYTHQPIFDLGTLLNKKLSMNVPVKPSVTMKYLLTQPPPI
jgi:Flp pilus assembly protein TadG